MGLQLSFSISEKCTTIYIRGNLNEHSSALNGVVVNPEFDLHIDLKDLTAINSLGIRNFNQWIHNIKCKKLIFFYCPRSFINQLNLVNGCIPPRSEIDSFFVPFYSEETGEDANVLFTKYLEYIKDNDKIVLRPPQVTDSQGNKMEYDILADQYFRFLNKYY